MRNKLLYFIVIIEGIIIAILWIAQGEMLKMLPQPTRVETIHIAEPYYVDSADRYELLLDYFGLEEISVRGKKELRKEK
jgi:hypothetical protein